MLGNHTILIFLMLGILTSCNLTFVMSHTEGADSGDLSDPQSATATPTANISLPLKALP